MSRTAGQCVPKYARHKASGQAVVTIAGIDRYLGPYGSVDSRTEYDRLIAEWLANGRQATGNPDSDLTVAELIERYREHVVVPQSSLMKSSGQSESPKYTLASLIALAS